MAKAKGSSGGGRGGRQGGGKGGGRGGAGWPAKTGNLSGKGRDNNPPRSK